MKQSSHLLLCGVLPIEVALGRARTLLGTVNQNRFSDHSANTLLCTNASVRRMTSELAMLDVVLEFRPGGYDVCAIGGRSVRHFSVYAHRNFGKKLKHLRRKSPTQLKPEA